MPAELKPVLERQMEVYAGFLEHTDHHVGRVIDAISDLGVLDDTIVYYIIGDNGASAEGTLNGAFNEMANFNGMAALETPSSWPPRWTSSGHRPRTTTTRWAGLTRWTPRSSGPSRSPRTGAAPVTARSCTGRTGSRRRAGCAPSSRTASTWPHDPRGRGTARADHGQRRAPVAHGGHEHALLVRRRGRRRAARPAVLRDVRQPRRLPPGLERGHQAPHPWDMVGGGAIAFDDDVWELYDGSADYSQARNLAAEHPRSCTRSSGSG
ncbi:sulfatase-like hydrolase/transferase [Oerskovia sp. M15]